MTDQDTIPTPPAIAGLTWRPLQPADQGAIAALSAACQAADGGQSMIGTDSYLRDGSAGATIGAFEAGGRLAACAAVWHEQTQQEKRANILGQVHPGDRGRGLGGFLMAWSVAKGRALLAGAAGDRQHMLRLTTEALTPAAERLYRRHGFTQEFAEDVMRRDLRTALPEAPFPRGVTIATWTPALAGQFFEAYQASFRERPGFPGWSAERWIEWATGDTGFHPQMSLLAKQGEQPVGFIVCDDAWIVQVGTHPSWRGRGLGAALVVEALRRFQAAGAEHVMLDVNVNNPRAARVYTWLGFDVIGRRARYVREP
ncbi:MAG TPA: GNAT family N-acetyltransferase [Roseiflexaceae bacterium]|nr:GNAT family N-acetyltransferase [Roseiflexaceae bacterium]